MPPPDDSDGSSPGFLNAGGTYSLTSTFLRPPFFLAISAAKSRGSSFDFEGFDSVVVVVTIGTIFGIGGGRGTPPVPGLGQGGA